jgi:hypothetical protein
LCFLWLHISMRTSSVIVVYFPPFFSMVGCWGRASTCVCGGGVGGETTFAKVPTARFKPVPPLPPSTPHPYLYHNKKRLKMAQCMTLPNSITSLIQYRPPGPSSIVLNKFYCIVVRQDLKEEGIRPHLW